MHLQPPPPPSSPWQLLYNGAHGLRRRWYHARARRLPRPVLSIGNLHWGGTGKTPLVAAVAAHLRDRGLAVAILSRGYASRGRGVRVVSAGQGPLLGPLLAGDEPVLLAGELPGVAVVVSPDRYRAGLHALRRLEPRPAVFVLDDGFSHLALQRDLDVLAFPAADPWAGGRLPPGGRLREPLRAVGRASAVVLTDSEESIESTGSAGAALADALRPYGFAGPGFASATRLGRPLLATGESLPPGEKVFLVTAIARPERFAASVRELGFEIAGELRFPDHHRFPPPSLERIDAAFRGSGAAAVLTTGKDRVKLLRRIEAPLAELPIRADPEPAFWSWLDRRLDAALAGLPPA